MIEAQALASTILHGRKTEPSAIKRPTTLKRTLVHASLSGLALSACANALQLAFPLFSIQIFDRYVPTGDGNTLTSLVFMFVVSIAILTIIEGCRSAIIIRIFRNYIASTYIRLYGPGSPMPSLLKPYSDLSRLTELTEGALPALILDTPFSLFFLVAIFIENIQLGLLALGAFLFMSAVSGLSSRLMASPNQEVFQKSDAFHVARKGVRDSDPALACMGLSATSLGSLANALWALTDARSRSSEMRAWQEAVVRLVRAVSQGAIYVLTAILVWKSILPPGAIIATTILFARAVAPAERLWSIGLGARELLRLSYQIDRVDFIPNSTAHNPAPHILGNITLSGVSFTPSTATLPLFYDVSLSGGPGKVVGVVGSSGAGKSALLQMVTGNLSPTHGTALLDETNIRNVTERAVWNEIGFLPQCPLLQPGTIAEFITRGSVLDMQEVAKACRLAGASEGVSRLRQGMETLVGEGQPPLPAGLTQAVALARAIYKEPRLIILDEPTSHADPGQEAHVAALLLELAGRGSAVFVSTRSAVIAQVCNEIVVLEANQHATLVDGSELVGRIHDAGMHAVAA